MRILQYLARVGLLAPLVVACSAGPNTSGNTSVACRPLSAAPTSRPAAWRGSVFTIVMENHSLGDILGNAAAPYINALAAQGGVADGYHDSYVHPSEPNYLWMVAGENFGILDDDDPGPSNTIASQSHLADQIELAGLTWRAYEESMGQPCGLSSHGTYAAKHDPFVYFSDINGWNGSSFTPGPRCTEHVVDYGQLDADIVSGALPDYVFITPNLDDDMHDGSVAAGDAWLATEVPKILATDAYKNGGALFLLWDEGSNSGDHPPFIAVSPGIAKGTVSQTSYDTSSFLLTVQDMLGVQALPCAAQPASVTPMSGLFDVPL
ncbi:MAG TPA: alkaline phosphatase family protein [Polyangiaceae bacterium]|jgi:acid phosphatase